MFRGVKYRIERFANPVESVTAESVHPWVHELAEYSRVIPTFEIPLRFLSTTLKLNQLGSVT